MTQKNTTGYTIWNSGTTTAGSVLISDGVNLTWGAVGEPYTRTTREKQICYVLAGNKTSFDMFLALGVEEQEKDTRFVFVEKVEDFDKDSYGGRLRILTDFFLSPNFESILKFLENRLNYYNPKT